VHKVTTELTKLGASARIDAYGGGNEGSSTLADLTYLSYRLGAVKERKNVTKRTPDLIWHRYGSGHKTLQWKKQSLVLRGDWTQGELNRITAAILAREFEKKNLHLFHSSATLYREKSILLMSGDSNHGKTMGLIEACTRGGEILATECLITDKKGKPLEGSHDVFLKARSKGTERVDKPEPTGGVAKFFKALPDFKVATENVDRIDAVILPSIDGNYDFSSSEMIPFEKGFQTFASLSDFYQSNTIVTPGIPMPQVDSVELRQRRAEFADDFARDKPYYFIKAANPQAVLDQVNRLIDSGAIGH
jgi:hypothetical protein